jgi:hypothetical protein
MHGVASQGVGAPQCAWVSQDLHLTPAFAPRQSPFPQDKGEIVASAAAARTAGPHGPPANAIGAACPSAFQLHLSLIYMWKVWVTSLSHALLFTM